MHQLCSRETEGRKKFLFWILKRPFKHTGKEGRWSATQEFLGYAIIRPSDERITEKLLRNGPSSLHPRVLSWIRSASRALFREQDETQILETFKCFFSFRISFSQHFILPRCEALFPLPVLRSVGLRHSLGNAQVLSHTPLSLPSSIPLVVSFPSVLLERGTGSVRCCPIHARTTALSNQPHAELIDFQRIALLAATRWAHRLSAHCLACSHTLSSSIVSALSCLPSAVYHNRNIFLKKKKLLSRGSRLGSFVDEV